MQLKDVPIDFVYENLTQGQKEFLVIRYKITQYMNEGLSVKEIANNINLSPSRVYKIIEKLR
jgi:predicted DNA-binding protein YlxM (UPF0122 family)